MADLELSRRTYLHMLKRRWEFQKKPFSLLKTLNPNSVCMNPGEGGRESRGSGVM